MSKSALKRNWLIFNLIPIIVIIIFLFLSKKYEAIILSIVIIAVNIFYVFIFTDANEVIFGGKLLDKFKFGLIMKRDKEKKEKTDLKEKLICPLSYINPNIKYQDFTNFLLLLAFGTFI